MKPDFADAYLNLGNVLKEEGEFQEAIASYRKAIEIKPDFADAYLNLGHLLSDDEDLVAATDAYAQYYRLKPVAQKYSFASVVIAQPFNPVSQLKVSENIEFIPSYISDAIPFGMHLMYVHIPKTGGVRFSNPIFNCIQELLLNGGLESHLNFVPDVFGRQNFSFMATSD